MRKIQLPRSGVPLYGFITGIALFVCSLVLDTPLHHIAGGKPAMAAGVALLMACWWMTDALPIYLTACIPPILFPLVGVFGGGVFSDLIKTLLQYLDPYIWLFAGGICIAAAMQQWGLHKRIALTIMRFIGTDPKHLLFGMLSATAFISLWLSNTACAALMFPIGMAVIKQLEHQLGGKRLSNYGMAIMLSIAYGSNIGLGTKIATTPNVMFCGFMEKMGMSVSFMDFLIVGMPFVLFTLPIIWYFLWRVARRDVIPESTSGDVIRQELHSLGHLKEEEWTILMVFLTASCVWIFSEPITTFLRPHVTLFHLLSAHVEGGVSLLAGIALLLLREKGHPVLAVHSLRGLPWATLILLGGSFAMASAIQLSGLSDWMGVQLLAIKELSGFVQVLLASVATVAITAVASNTATIAIMMNVLKGIITPALLPTALYASTISCSCDFALPAGTPPNAIVFGSGYVTIPQMAKTGVLLDGICAILSAVWCWFIVRLIM
ncbi:MAG: DASS family sodium-coupled anion symporter [bacterium]